MSLAKIPLIVITTALYDRAYTPPVSTETEEEQKKALRAAQVSLTERIIPGTTLMVKVCHLYPSLHCLLILSRDLT